MKTKELCTVIRQECIGTDIYSLKDNSQPDIAAYHNGKYIYYEKVTEDEFYTAVSICNE